MTKTMKVRSRGNNATMLVSLALVLSISTIECEAWLPQRNYVISSSNAATTGLKRKRNSITSVSLFGSTSIRRASRNYDSKLFSQPGEQSNKEISGFPKQNPLPFYRRRAFRFLAAGLVSIMLFPFRVSAAAAEAPVAVAETAAAAAPKAAAAAAAYCAAPPVPSSVETKLTLRLIYAALLGAGLGKERSFAKHSAGVRTMALVAMGASAYTVCSAYGFASFGHYDPGRMASNVASGVGFVGAGVITTSASRNQNVVHGLTTAATIWLSAAVGVACGVGLFQIATTAAVATVTILRLGRIKPKNRYESIPSAAPTSVPEYEYTYDQAAEMHADDDEDDFEDDQKQALADHYADTHDTTEWDEKQHEPPPLVEFISHDGEDRIVVAQDADIQSIIEQAWRGNSTDFALNSTHFSMNVVGLQKVEEPSAYRRP